MIKADETVKKLDYSIEFEPPYNVKLEVKKNFQSQLSNVYILKLKLDLSGLHTRDFSSAKSLL